MEKRLLRLSVLFMSSLLTCISCGGNNGEDNTNNSIKLSIQIPFHIISSTQPSIQSTTEDIKTITITVEGSDFSTIEETFNFPGQIRLFVPTGTNRTFSLQAFDANGQLIFTGTIGGVTISPGENTVTISLIPVVPTTPPPSTPPPSAGADLSITKSGSPNPVVIGNNLTYTLLVRNNGPSATTGVVVTDTLPPGVTFFSSFATQGNCSGASAVTCNVGNLADRASVTITIVVTVNRGERITNTADVIGNEKDPDLSNNRATAVTTVSFNRQIVNDLVIFSPNSPTCEPVSDMTGCPSGFVGECSITASLTDKRTSPPLSDLLIRVNTITNGNLLQNADGGPGGVGATLTPPRTSLSPGESEDIQFLICLTANGESFDFFVDVLGVVQ